MEQTWHPYLFEDQKSIYENLSLHQPILGIHQVTVHLKHTRKKLILRSLNWAFKRKLDFSF